MPRRQQTTDKKPVSTRESLSSTIKTIRNIMRKDKGLNGDLDRLPMLTWLMFLKFLDDSDELHKVSDELAGRTHNLLIEPPYRWRDWAGHAEGLTGPELIAFINQDEAMRPDGVRGAGLFAYLKTRSGGRGDVLANVFRELQNRMSSGYLLRDVVNKISEISFASSESIHTLSHLYESMLREMRDSAGDSGEFYTPRPVVKFMIQVLDPKLGERVLDPACGTGGFLVESYEHMKEQAIRAEHFRVLQEESLFGQEAKSLPYLLAQMNLVLHGIESPNITIGNSLAIKLTEVGDDQRVDVIATNPPFGGEEEHSIQDGFPADKRTSETALLFLQLIMRRLRRQPRPGRAGVVVPNGVLFGDGICARIKEELLHEFNLHTVVRLAAGAFSPYTDIQTNLLFFDRTGPTKEVWFYELPLSPGKKKYSKTAPMSVEEFEPVARWLGDRAENDHAWVVPAHSVLANGFNLDLRNPRSRSQSDDLAPDQIAGRMLANQADLTQLLVQIRDIVGGSPECR
jgi:type I restriction enzyme M protein